MLESFLLQAINVWHTALGPLSGVRFDFHPSFPGQICPQGPPLIGFAVDVVHIRLGVGPDDSTRASPGYIPSVPNLGRIAGRLALVMNLDNKTPDIALWSMTHELG